MFNKHHMPGVAAIRGVGKAFSLVEVVVAVGIFALAIVGVIGLLVPTGKSISDVADTDSASRVISAIQAGLQKAGFTTVQNALSGTQFYASKDGSKVGLGSDTTLWTSGQNQEKFFEFTLARNTALSPSGNDPATGKPYDDAAGFLAFTIILKWPAYAPTSDGVTGTAVDPAQKSVMVVPAAITR